METAPRLKIGLFINELDGAYQSEVLRGLRAAAREENVQLLCFAGNELGSDNSFWRSEANLIFELGRRVALDGVLSVTASFGWSVPPEALTRFFARLGSIPVVSVGSAAPGIPVIKPDNRIGMSELVDHFLHHHGFRRIAFICGPEHNEDARERLAVFRERHVLAGVPIEESLVIPGTFFQLAGRFAVERLLAGGRMPQAIIAANDQMGFAAIATLAEHGLRVPEDVAVGGFDDLSASLADCPPLTSVRQETAEQARLGLHLLVRQLRGGETAPRETMVPTRVIVRRSCGCSGSASLGDHASLWEAPDIARRELGLLRTALQEELAGATGRLLQALQAASTRAQPDGKGLTDPVVGRGAQNQQAPLHDLYNMLRVLHRECADRPVPAAPGRPGAGALLFAAQAWLYDSERMNRAAQTLEREFPSWMFSNILLTRLSSRDLNLASMLGWLRQGLLSLKVLNAYVVLYPRLGTMSSWDVCDVPEEGQLVLAIRDGETMATTDFDRFPTGELLPMPVFHQDAPALYGVLPIFQQQEHYGYLVIDVSRLYSVRVEQLRETISNLVTSTMVVGELDRARELLRQDLDRAQTSNQQLAALAEHDELTRLLNRRGFFSHAARGDTGSGAMLISADMDGLKTINDTWGHSAGDAALCALAAALRATFRSDDLIARFGGDEFAVLSRGGVSPHAQARVRDRLSERIAAFNRESGQPWTLAVSLGIVTVPPDVHALEPYLEDADQLLYEEKRERKGSIISGRFGAEE